MTLGGQPLSIVTPTSIYNDQFNSPTLYVLQAPVEKLSAGKYDLHSSVLNTRAKGMLFRP